MGFIAGTWINPPMPPKFRLEWEDKELVNLLVFKKSSVDEFKSYIHRRIERAELVGELTGVSALGITLKSPLLAIKWHSMMAAISDFDLQPIVVKCTRSWPKPDGNLDVYKRGQPDEFEWWREANRSINRGLMSINGHEFNYDYARQNPQHCANCLADLLGVTNEDDVKAAAETIQ